MVINVILKHCLMLCLYSETECCVHSFERVVVDNWGVLTLAGDLLPGSDNNGLMCFHGTKYHV